LFGSVDPHLAGDRFGGGWQLCGVLMSIGELAVNGALGTTNEARPHVPSNPTVYNISAPPQWERVSRVGAAR
jgi:hypothetical protein